MAFDMDTGPQGSEGPWVQWSARGTQDGEVPAKSFFLRDKDKKKSKIDAFEKGVVLDIDNLKTGWCYTSGAIGSAPEWKLGASPARLPEKPGDEYKKGFQVRCAISKDQSADWHQSGAAVWSMLVDLSDEFSAGSKANPGKLPVVKLDGVKALNFTKGSTVQPLMKIVKWVDRPACLEDGAGGIDTGDQATPEPEPTPAGDGEF